MDENMTPPALPQLSDTHAFERVPEPIAAMGMIALMAMMWLAGWLVLSPIWAGTPVGGSLREMRPVAFSPLPVTTRLPQILIADPSVAKVEDSEAMTAWNDTRHQAEYVAGALVEDEVQGVLLKLHLLAETGKFVGRMVSVK